MVQRVWGPRRPEFESRIRLNLWRKKAMKLKNLLMLLATLALLVGASGCIFSPDDPPVEPTPGGGLDDPTTPDKLMINFKEIYEDMNSGEFEALLHADYRTVLLQETFDAWEGSDNPLTELFFDKTSEVSIHRRMFENFEGVDEAGIVQPPIDSISVDVIDRDGSWEPVEESEEYFGGRNAYKAEYDLLIYFATTGNHRFEVGQRVFFYVIQGSDGLWKMLGQKGIAN